MDKVDAFIKMVGDIGENYEEEDWHCRLGVFGMGWDKGVESMAKEVEKARILQFSPTGDNHHNAALCPHCGQPLQEAVDIMKRMLEGESMDEARKFIKRSGL